MIPKAGIFSDFHYIRREKKKKSSALFFIYSFNDMEQAGKRGKQLIFVICFQAHPDPNAAFLCFQHGKRLTENRPAKRRKELKHSTNHGIIIAEIPLK